MFVRRLSPAVGSRLVWGAYIFWLGQTLSSSDFGLALMIMAVSWVISSLVNPVSSGTDLNGDPPEWQAALAQVFLRWLMYCLALGTAFASDVLPDHLASPLVILLLGGLPLILAARQIGRTYMGVNQPGGANADLTYPILVFALSIGANNFGVSQPETLVSLHLLCLLLLFPIDWSRLPPLFAEPDISNAASRCPADRLSARLSFLQGNIDLLWWPFIFAEPILAVPYLLAKGLAALVRDAMGELEHALSVHTRHDRGRSKRETAIMASAARINLGFLFVGSSAMIAVLGLGALTSTALALQDPPFSSLLLWLVLGQGAPAIFGATHLFMTRSGLQTAQAGITLAMLVVTACLLSALKDGNPSTVAATLALCQLARGAICALVLGAYRGIWPGLTAVLQRQLKLT